LDFLGFPWILSSESRLINGLRGFLREEYFSRPSLALRPATMGADARGHAEAQDCSSGKLKLISDFLQEIVSESYCPFRRLPPKAARTGSFSPTGVDPNTH
jgi:hypothetical protein